MNLTDEDVDEILKLLDRSPYDELKLVTDRFTLELRPGGPRPETTAATAGTLDAIAETVTTRRSAPAAGGTVDIRAPLPGTFYRAPSPGADPFTEVGMRVGEDTILGLVETMKLMNSVVAGCRGEVAEICAKNGTLVETGDVLVRIRVDSDG